MINKDKEVGGTHYADMKIEPIELIEAFGLDFVQGSIIKYISRYKNKNGIEDLKKALHYCKMNQGEDRINFDKITTCVDFSPMAKLSVKMYCMLNNLTDLENLIIGYVVSNDLDRAAKEIENLINR